jgi:hypothetical protein
MATGNSAALRGAVIGTADGISSLHAALITQCDKHGGAKYLLHDQPAGSSPTQVAGPITPEAAMRMAGYGGARIS